MATSAGNRSMLPSARRSPALTATSPTEMVATISSTVEERNASTSTRIGGAAVTLGDRRDRAGLPAGAAEQAQRRQALHHVEEVPGERLAGLPLLVRTLLGGPADEGREQGNQRQGDRDGDRRAEVDDGEHDEHRRAAGRRRPPARAGTR